MITITSCYHQQSNYNRKSINLKSKHMITTFDKISIRTTSCIILISILVIITLIDCQELQRNNQTTLHNNNSSSLVINETSSTSGEVILSGDEFVDFTEAPILLIDGTLNDNSSSTTTTTTSTSAPTTTFSDNSTGSRKVSFIETSTTIPTTTITSEEIPENDEGLPDEESDDETNGKEEENKSFEPPKNVSQYMDYIEHLFHDLRHQITDLFEPHIPQLIRTSQMVQLSSSCSYDMLKLALALRQFEPWALKMIDSSGKVPEGIFEGSFTALGSYDECLSTNFGGSSSSSNADNGDGDQKVSQVTKGKYCLVNLSPFMPPKPPADNVERMFQEEANRRNYTKDDQFSRLSPMFYYMKFRIGVCVPSTCVDSDLESISNALSSSLRLNITIPHCKVRQGSIPLTNHQLAGGFIFGLVLIIVIISTLLDYKRNKSSKLSKLNKIVMMKTTTTTKHLDGKLNTTTTSCSVPVIIRRNDNQKGDHYNVIGGSLCNDKETENNSFFRKHWSWMSFSLITNYKLYFEGKSFKFDNLLTNNKQRTSLAIKPNQSTMMIECLNGIRVLSLCWVIIANSYITLDPRATKRLTKTREAPKDFLFQMVVQASLAIETFFFLSGVLMSLSFARKLKPTVDENKVKENVSKQNYPPYMNSMYCIEKLRRGRVVEGEEAEMKNHKTYNNKSNREIIINWMHFYVHRYIRMTPATMLVIAFTMFAFRYGDGPLWIETTHKAHSSCNENWWRHLLHVANFIDTRQMCFIHYWYIAADMQLFLFAPILMFLIYKYRRLGYTIISLVGFVSIGNIFYTTYVRNLPPTLLFYNSDPESRREFGNTIMTKPLTHALPYIVGMLVGKWLTTVTTTSSGVALSKSSNHNNININRQQEITEAGKYYHNNSNSSLTTLFGLIALLVALGEVFLPYKWNNSYLPTRFLASLYAALFRLAWSLALAYLVITCRHKLSTKCFQNRTQKQNSNKSLRTRTSDACCKCSIEKEKQQIKEYIDIHRESTNGNYYKTNYQQQKFDDSNMATRWCFCGSSGNILNRFLSLGIFSQLSKLSFVAYLIHLPLMSVFVAQTRGLFAFSHTLVIHLALSYLLMTFILSFILVHIIEFPFSTFERYLFRNLFHNSKENINYDSSLSLNNQNHQNSYETLYDRKRAHNNFEGSLEMWQIKRDVDEVVEYSKPVVKEQTNSTHVNTSQISERL